MSPLKCINIIFPDLCSFYCSMKYWLTISSTSVKMVITLRLVIADLALFYVEKSVKSERTLHPKLEAHLCSSFVNCPKNVGFPTIPVLFVPQLEVSPRPPPPPFTLKKNTEFREFSSSFHCPRSPVKNQGGNSMWATEGTGYGCDTVWSGERGGTALLQPAAEVVRSTLEASFFIRHSHLLLNVQSKGGMLSHNLKDRDMKKGLWCWTYRPSKCYRPKQVPISNNSSPPRRFDIQNWWALIPRARSDPATLRPLGNPSDPGVKPW